MSQITTGVFGFLAFPFVYDSFQGLIGAKKFRKAYLLSYVQPRNNFRILDIGCGTGEILNFLPESIEYYGYDLSPEYISAAQRRYHSRGRWYCSSVSDMRLEDFGTFDVVMANGVFHHLDDEEARKLAEVAFRALKKGGRFCSFDGCYTRRQNPIARFLISRDRGKNVRIANEYRDLLTPYFDSVHLTIRHDMLRVPYTHAIAVATKS
jgi:SAM-dependent methyltransferase